MGDPGPPTEKQKCRVHTIDKMNKKIFDSGNTVSEECRPDTLTFP